MLEFMFDPQFYWPYMALLLASYLFAFIGARAVFHPDPFMTASRCLAAQMIALAAVAALWGYVGYRFGLAAAFLGVMSAWLSCCAGTRRGRHPAGEEDAFNLRIGDEFGHPTPEDLG